MVARCLAGGVRARGVVTRFLRKEPVFAERAVDLVGADVVKKPRATLPVLATGFEQLKGAFDIGADELTRPENAAVDVAFRREVHHQIRLVARKQPGNLSSVSNIHVLETVVRGGGDITEAQQVGRVG
jgi:hypothetical protein